MFGNMYTKLLKVVFSTEGHRIFKFLLNICLCNSKFLKILNTAQQKKKKNGGDGGENIEN